MKKELLTGALATTMALTSSAHWGRGGCYGWPAIGFGLLAGGLAARAYSDAVWASRGYVLYGYGVAVAPVVTTPVVYQQPVQQVVYQQPAPVVYSQQAQQPVYPQQAPAVQPAPQPQEIRIVVDHQCAVQTSVTTNTVQLQRQ